MALRAVPDHPKFADLMATLNLPKFAALGLLEGVWHFTGRYAPQGNVGKYSDQAIETWVGWNGPAGVMVEALVKCGWINRDAVSRLLVHDWDQHADKATKNALKRAKLSFCTPAVRTPSVPSTNENPNLGTASRLPVPEPVVSNASHSHPAAEADREKKQDPDGFIYDQYPRKVGRGAAIPEIQKAVERIRKGEGLIPPMPDKSEARAYLFHRVQAYARSPLGSRPDKEMVPHPSTWFHQSRYLDDDNEWEYTGGENGKDRKPNGRAAPAVAATPRTGPIDLQDQLEEAARARK